MFVCARLKSAIGSPVAAFFPPVRTLGDGLMNRSLPMLFFLDEDQLVCTKSTL